jgi:cytochrome c oxidase subunit 2
MTALAQASTWAKYWLPPVVTEHGKRVDAMTNWIHYFMLVLFIGWGIFFCYCLMRFRKSAHPQAQYEPIKAKLSKWSELGVVVIEAVLLVGFSMPVWALSRDLDNKPTADENPLIVRVVAQQFQWNVHYAGPDGKFGPCRTELVDAVENPIGLDRDVAEGKDDIVSLNWLRVPKGRKVICRLTSLDVIHCFWLPFVRIKQDTIPGMEIPVWFAVDQTSEEIRPTMVRTVKVPEPGLKTDRWLKLYNNRIAMQDYGDAVKKNAMITPPVMEALQSAGVAEIEISPVEPMEIHCAQLCGLNHYSMRGFFKVMEEDEWNAWQAAEVEELLEEEDDW